MNLYILSDMEGACGIYKQEQFTPGAPDWKQWGRSCLTDDIRTAAEGARLAGVERIIVRDYHGWGTNVFKDRLPEFAKVVGGIRLRPIPVIGKKQKYPMAFLIAQHAAMDAPGAFYPHIFHHHVKSVRINGRAVSETEILAAVLGEGLETPVGLISGDPVLLEGIAGNFPWAELVPCSKDPKDFETDTKTKNTLRREREDLFRKSKKAVERVGEMKRFQFQSPIRMEIELHFPESPIAKNTWGLTRISGTRFALERPDFMETFSALFNFLFIPKAFYPLVIGLGCLGNRVVRTKFFQRFYT